MDKDDYNLIKDFIKQFAQERPFPLREIIEMIFNVVMCTVPQTGYQDF